MIFSERPLVLTGYKDAYMPSYAGEGGGGGRWANRPFIVIDHEDWKLDWTVK